jgi:hypothetical protein
MEDIIIAAVEAGSPKKIISDLEILREEALAAIAMNIKIEEGVDWKEAYDRANAILSQKGPKVKVKHPGVLEVPEGKSVEKMPLKHFKTLIKKKGRGAISKALVNLVRWNKRTNPTLSKWASSMLSKIKDFCEKNPDACPATKY